MPIKKQELPPRLSEYLLKKAEPFEFYPKRIYGLVPEVRQIFTDLARELVDWRKTFQPKGDNRQLHFFAQPVMLDQFYSKELLAWIPTELFGTNKSGLLSKDESELLPTQPRNRDGLAVKAGGEQ